MTAQLSQPEPKASTTGFSTNVRTLLNTLENERHARAALLVAFVAELEAVVANDPKCAPIMRALSGEVKAIPDEDFDSLLEHLRAAVREKQKDQRSELALDGILF